MFFCSFFFYLNLGKKELKNEKIIKKQKSSKKELKDHRYFDLHDRFIINNHDDDDDDQS